MPIGFYAIGTLGALLLYVAIIAFVASDPLYRKKPKADGKRVNSDQYKSESSDRSVEASFIKEQQPPTDRYEAYSNKQIRDRFDHVLLGIGLATLVAGVIYTETTVRLYRTAVDSFHADQRPWVGITYIDIDEFRPRGDGSLLPSGQIRIKNFGPRVARNTVFVGGPIVDQGSDYEQICEEAERDCGAAWTFATGEGHEGWSNPSRKGKPIGGVLFPEQEYPTSLEGPVGALVLTRQLPTEIYIPGCVVYLDQFGEKHKTRLCFEALYNGQQLGPEQWQQCRECNDAE